MRRRLEQESIFAGNSGRISVLIVLDFSIDHGSGAMSALQVHKNFKLPSRLKVERTVEDKLLMLGLNLEHESSVHYTITDEHANDRRRLDSRLRVIVANDYQDSRWLQN